MKISKDTKTFSEVVEDSIDSEVFTDTEGDEVSKFPEIVPDSMDEEDDEDPIDSEMVPDTMDEEDVEDNLEDVEDNLNIDLNIPEDNGLDLNKFPDEEDDSSDEIKKEYKKLRKIYLPKFY
ncbi:hypothetical protein MTR_3g114650 [Medicago truncatula]|uniref:Uncharacterized protein n=1 Tax=Medicago truncatula TaxID=3880 RepID=G7J5V8_MEDTR|nr:hypothetical protein MTR_3g114650 [Medicago truncatula]